MFLNHIAFFVLTFIVYHSVIRFLSDVMEEFFNMGEPLTLALSFVLSVFVIMEFVALSVEFVQSY